MAEVRQHRVAAFCDWLETIPGEVFHAHPAFVFYQDLTDDEIDAAELEMRRRARALFAEADALEAARAARNA